MKETGMIVVVDPLKLIETEPGSYSLLLNAVSTPVDEVVQDLGHEPNGYFWEGVAHFLSDEQGPGLAGRFDYDSEAGMFCAYGSDRAALEELASLLAPVANESARVRDVVMRATTAGFEFDD
jgi:hypothetical protein